MGQFGVRIRETKNPLEVYKSFHWFEILGYLTLLLQLAKMICFRRHVSGNVSIFNSNTGSKDNTCRIWR